jgi:hypothetical protein
VSLREDPPDLLKVANGEPFLVHIVAVLRLYAVLFHLLPQNSEILAMRSLRVSLVPCKVNGVKVSAIQDVLVSSFKVCRPVFARLLATYMKAHRVTIAGGGGKHQSQSFCISLTSTSSCLLVNSCFVSLALAIETLFPWKCLLSADLSTSNILAASEILGL